MTEDRKADGWEGRSTRSFLMSSLTFAVVSEDCFPLDVSLMSVDRKFLHFFTFSSVSCKHSVRKNTSEVSQSVKAH